MFPRKNLLIEILPRILWILMLVLLILSEKFVTPVLRFRENVFILIIGIIIITFLGLIVWVWVGYCMRKAFFDKSLLISGPFKYVRHPMYVGLYLLFIGTGILFFSYPWFIIMIFFMPIWYFNCRIEEKQMTAIHGEKYTEYRKRIGMFFPKLK